VAFAHTSGKWSQKNYDLRNNPDPLKNVFSNVIRVIVDTPQPSWSDLSK
jgi:hypothetical protein